MDSLGLKTTKLANPKLVVALAAALAISTQGASATNFVVDTATDESFDGNSLALEQADGTGLSLREAIGLADHRMPGPRNSGDLDGDTITFSPTAFLFNHGWMLVADPQRPVESQSAEIEQVTLSLDPGMADRIFNRIKVVAP